MIEIVNKGWRKSREIAKNNNNLVNTTNFALEDLNINAIINPTDENFSKFPGENAYVYFSDSELVSHKPTVLFPFDNKAGISETTIDSGIKIIHLIGPSRMDADKIENFRKSFIACLEIASKTEIDSLGFPTIGYSAYEIQTYTLGEIVISETRRYIEEGKLKRFVCIAHSEYLFNLYKMLVTLPISVLPHFITFTDERIRKYHTSQNSLAKAIQKLEKAKKKIEQYNSLLEQQKKDISDQNEILQQQKQNITDSLKYASLIQKAELPPSKILKNNLSDYFILYYPCQIVSGDFYWFKQIDNLLYIASADCTGHGVPGALMSMLGVSLLNEIVGNKNLKFPFQILSELRYHIKKSLHQTGKRGEQQDGMDIAFCMLDKTNQKLYYAGAFNPLYLIRDGQLLVFKADRMPIGVHIKEKSDFTNTVINLQNNDSIYIFSDGYADQFGGDNDERYKSKRFRELLLSISKYTMKEQINILKQEHEKWRGNLQQTDDILIIGFKIDF